MSVYVAIQNVMRDIGVSGISKDRKNAQQGYAFRGIDDVYNDLNPIMVLHGLLMLPRVMSSEQVERQSKSGGVIIYTRLAVEFDFVAAIDGSKHTIATVGEAMDSADKSSNKAMAAAYKYAAMMAFCIPTEGDNDADNNTPDIKPMSKTQSREPYKKMQEAAASFETARALHGWWDSDAAKEERAQFPEDWRRSLKDEVVARMNELKAKEATQEQKEAA